MGYLHPSRRYGVQAILAPRSQSGSTLIQNLAQHLAGTRPSQ